jgi:uncharacterized protein DUF4062
MKVFISSLITGMDALRSAAREAVLQLGHEPVMAEDFGAQPHSPQVACLSGVRGSGLMILILGTGYGAKQASGLSATHEEYREAKERCPVIAFVEQGVTRDADQAAFVREVQSWESGLYRDGFSGADQLRQLITLRLHEWELANAARPVNESQLLAQALSLLPEEDRGHYRSGGRSLVLAIAAGPSRALLRPSELEKPSFQEELLQLALFGADRIFTPAKATTADIEEHALILTHDDGAGTVRLDGQGNLTLKLPLTEDGGHGMVVIQENVTRALAAGLRYAVALLDRIDPTQRITHVALAATLSGRGDTAVWRTQREQDASPNSYSMGFGREGRNPVHLTPAVRPRPALRHQASQLVEDLVTLLRREWRSR